jgi:hypothetical protein
VQFAAVVCIRCYEFVAVAIAGLNWHPAVRIAPGVKQPQQMRTILPMNRDEAEQASRLPGKLDAVESPTNGKTDLSGSPTWADGTPVLRSRHDRRSGITWIEVLMMVAVLTLLAAFLLPTLVRRSRPQSRGMYCINNLKQVGLAFRIWQADNNDLFPMQVSTNYGGTLEWIGGPNAFRHFEVMSNELNTPKILFCPKETDPSRTMATLFGTALSMGAGWQIPFTNNLNLSYFVGVDASETYFNAFLCGDRNLTNGTLIKGGLIELTTNQLAGWTDTMHVHQGNVGLADGSVQSLTTSALREALKRTGLATNRLAMP